MLQRLCCSETENAHRRGHPVLQAPCRYYGQRQLWRWVSAAVAWQVRAWCCRRGRQVDHWIALLRQLRSSTAMIPLRCRGLQQVLRTAGTVLDTSSEDAMIVRLPGDVAPSQRVVYVRCTVSNLTAEPGSSSGGHAVVRNIRRSH